MKRSAREDNRGFTLLELLVSVAITMVIIALLFTALIAYKKLRFDQTKVTEVRHSMRAAFSFIHRDLDNAGFRLNNDSTLCYFGCIFPNNDASDSYSNNVITVWSNANNTISVVMDTMTANDSPLVVDAADGLAAGDKIWIIGTCTDGLIRRESFEISTIDTAGPFIIHHDNPPNPSASLANRYRKGAKIVKIKQVTYELANTVDGISDLTRKENEKPPAVIASGIDQLIFTYYDAANPPAVLTPSNSSARKTIRRLNIALSARSQAKMLLTKSHADLSFSGDVAPRNLILMEGR